jgi:hypothetical protein
MKEALPFLVPILIASGLFIMIGWIVWVDARRRHNQSKIASEIHGKLLDKFASSQELVDFLQTNEGRRFLESAGGPRANPLERVLKSIKLGVILTIVGLGWLLLGLTQRFDDEGALSLIGFLFESVGIGFLVSAAISYYFSKRWGLYAGTGLPRPDMAVSKPEETA